MRELEDAFRSIVDRWAEGVWAVDTAGRVRYANERIAQMLGYPRDALLGRSFADFVSEESRARVLAGFARRRAGRGETYDVRFVRHDGEILDVLASMSPTFAPDGAWTGVLAILVDVTERVRTERALRESEARYRALFEHAPVMLHSIDPEGRLLSVSDTWCRTLGYSREEAVGRRSTDFLTPASREFAAHFVLPTYFRTGECRDVPYQFVRKDGVVLDTLLSATAERDESGRVVRSLAVVIDVTEQKRAATALRESEARFQTLARMSPVGIFRTDGTGACVYVNERWCEMTGLPPGGVGGDAWLDAVHPDDRARVAATWRQAVAGHAVSCDEYRFLRPDGRVTWVFGQAVPEVGERGELLGHVGTVTDITERKVSEEALYRSRGELERVVAARTADLAAANRELETFAYSVSHDLRAPLRAIDGFGQLLDEDYGALLDERGRGYLKRLRVATRRTSQIIDDILRLSRVTRAELRREHVDVTALARDIVTNLRQSSPERVVDFVVPDGLFADADPALLRILLENLLGNAFKFTGHHATARIEVGRRPDGAFFVRDDGAGFDMAHVGELFKPFRRLHGLDEFEGTGIGLATVARIVERHGGRVWAEGAVEKGATFSFTLGP